MKLPPRRQNHPCSRSSVCVGSVLCAVFSQTRRRLSVIPTVWPCCRTHTFDTLRCDSPDCPPLPEDQYLQTPACHGLRADSQSANVSRAVGEPVTKTLMGSAPHVDDILEVTWILVSVCGAKECGAKECGLFGPFVGTNRSVQFWRIMNLFEAPTVSRQCQWPLVIFTCSACVRKR